MIETIEWIRCYCEATVKGKPCGRDWVPRVIDPLPKQCAFCRSRNWNGSDKVQDVVDDKEDLEDGAD